MAYDTDKLYEQALEEIDKNNLFFVSDVVAYLGIAESTFYEHFPPDSEKHNIIKKCLGKNSLSKHLDARDRILTNKKHKGVGYVYIVKCGDFNLYKVGVSKTKPKQRLSSLQAGCPFPLYMIELYYCNYYSLLESEIHKRYKKYNKMGEWFELTDAQLLCLKSEIEEQSTKQINLF